MKRKIFLCILLFFLVTACGKKGPPFAPLDTTPLGVNNLKRAQQGEKVVLTWSLPKLSVDKTPLAEFKEAEIYSYSQNISSLTSSKEEFDLNEVLKSSDWKKTIRKKAKKIFVINKSNKKQYVIEDKIHYEMDLHLVQRPTNYLKLFSFAVKTVSPKGKRSDWSNIVGIIPWQVPLPAQELKAEVKEEEIEISWQSPQENIDGSKPVNLIGYNIYRRTPKDSRFKRKNDKLLFSGPLDWGYSNISAIEVLQTEEGKNILQLAVDKSTTSAYLYQDLTEEKDLSELRGKNLDISFKARIVQEEEAKGSILLDDGVNTWGSQNEKEMTLTNQWKEYGFNIAVDDNATKLTLYLKPTRFPVDISFQIEHIEAILLKVEEEEKEEEINTNNEIIEEQEVEEEKDEQEKKETDQSLEEEEINLIRNGDFSLLQENKFSDEDFEFGQHYIYSVRAVSRKWRITGESSDSQELAVTPLDIFPPLQPTGLSAITGAGIVSLSWDANEDADLLGYNIYRREEGEADFKLVNQEPLTKTIFQDDKVIPGKVYFYTVSALDDAEPPNESEKSEEVRIRAQ